MRESTKRCAGERHFRASDCVFIQKNEEKKNLCKDNKTISSWLKTVKKTVRSKKKENLKEKSDRQTLAFARDTKNHSELHRGRVEGGAAIRAVYQSVD